MMKRSILIAILFLGGMILSPIVAQKFSIAYIDMQYILKNIP